MRITIGFSCVLFLAIASARPAFGEDPPIRASDLRVLPQESKAGARRRRCSTVTSSTRPASTSTPGGRAIAAIKTPEDIAERQPALRSFFLESLGDLPDADAAERPGRGHPDPTRRSIASRKSSSRAGPIITSRRISTCPTASRRSPACCSPAATATTARPTKTISALHPAGPERHGRLLLRPDRPGRAVPDARWQGQAGDPRHDRAHDGRHRGAAGRPAAGQLSDLGRHAGTRLPGQPARGRSPSARLHRQLRRRHPDGVPDGPRRPDRRGGPVVLHHVARTALRHDRSAGRRAEHHRPGRRRDGSRRFHHDAGTRSPRC